MRYAVGVLVVGGLVAGCGGGDGDKDDLRVGLLAPLSGRAESVGESFARVAETAVREINDAGGVDGHRLVLVVRDTLSTEEGATTGYQALVEQDQVIAVVGPALSDNVAAVVPLARAAQVPFISPSSTATSLIGAEDGGFMFRNVPDDDLQAVAQAYFLTSSEPADGPRIQSVTVLHETGAYGMGLAEKFASEVERQCATCTVPHVRSFTKGLSQAGADAVIADLAALTPQPEWIMVVALVEDGSKLITAWDGGNGPTLLPDARWFMTDGLRVGDFLAGLPASMADMMGTAPTVPENSDAHDVLRAAYDASNVDSLDDQVFAANVWDAYFLIAAALAQQMHDGGGLGGAGLRDALFQVSAGPGQIFHAGQWAEMVAAILGGAEVDYDGASGPNDFTDEGETPGPFEVWRIAGAPGTYTFERVIFLSAATLQDLRDN